MPRRESDACVSAEMSTGDECLRCDAMKPPSTTPARKARFHDPARRQSYWKYRTLGAMAAQIWLRFAEIPNALLPTRRRTGTNRPMSGPATYQGHSLASQEVIFECLRALGIRKSRRFSRSTAVSCENMRQLERCLTGCYSQARVSSNLLDRIVFLRPIVNM